MNYAEVVSLYGNVHEERNMQMFDTVPCNQCGIESGNLLMYTHHDPFFHRLVGILKGGWSGFEPRYHTVGYGDQVQKIYVGGTGYLIGFCSKRCYIDYICDHQAELVELITQ